MAWPFPHPPATPTTTLQRRLRALDRRVAFLTRCSSASDPRLPDHLLAASVHPTDRGGSGVARPVTGNGSEDGGRPGITERNGIWVLTIGRVWHGDYRERAQAEAAAQAVKQARQ